MRAPLSPSESDPLPFLDPVKKAWILAAAANNVGQTKLTPCTNDAKIDIWRKKNIETFKQSSRQNWKTVTFTSNISLSVWQVYHHKVDKLLIIRVGSFESSYKKILSSSQWQIPILVTLLCTGQPRCVEFHFDTISVQSFSDNTLKPFSLCRWKPYQQIISKILNSFPLKTW